MAGEYYLCTAVEERTTKTGKKFLQLQLLSRSGQVAGKVWEDALSAVDVRANAVVHLEGKRDSYNGQEQLIIHSGWIAPDIEPSEFLEELQPTPTMVFDIETLGKPFTELDEGSQAYFLHRLEKPQDDSPTSIQEAQGKTGLHPLFGSVVAIACLSVRGTGKTFAVIPPGTSVHLEDERYAFVGCHSEAELLTHFWEEAKQYQRFVTYNGRNFDWPYLVFRSGVQRVPVTVPFTLWGQGDSNIDLCKEIPPGSRSYTLAEVNKALGLSNPKEAGVSGGDVNELVAAGRYEDLANYVSRDVASTLELYNVWRKYMVGRVIV